jgi:hypothetical protein
MNRSDLATSVRLGQCFTKLDNSYPEWTEELIFQIERFRKEATPNQRLGRLIGSELDAALDDPRWEYSLA